MSILSAEQISTAWVGKSEPALGKWPANAKRVAAQYNSTECLESLTK